MLAPEISRDHPILQMGKESLEICGAIVRELGQESGKMARTDPERDETGDPGQGLLGPFLPSRQG